MIKLLTSAVASALVLACAPVAAPPAPISPGLTWQVSTVGDGAEASLFEADGRRTATVRCQAGRLFAEAPRLRPTVGPAPQVLYLHLGGEPIALAQNPSGWHGGSRPPADIRGRIFSATAFRLVLGDQSIGPHIPPTGRQAEILASACARATGAGSAPA